MLFHVSRQSRRRQHLFHNVPMHICQATLQAVMVERQSFVIQSHQVQQRCVEVVDGCFVDGCLETEFVAFAVAEALFDSGAGQKTSKRTGVVVTARSVALQERHAAKFGGPHDQCIFQHAALFEIGEQCSRWLIHDLRLHCVSIGDVGVRVPICDSITASGVATVEQLHNPNAFFQQTASKNTVAGVTPQNGLAMFPLGPSNVTAGSPGGFCPCSFVSAGL